MSLLAYEIFYRSQRTTVVRLLAMSDTELFLLSMLMIIGIPYLIWRISQAGDMLPLVVVQILCGVLLGPGVLGTAFPKYYSFIFRPQVVNKLDAVSTWAILIFMWSSGLELELRSAWRNRRDTIMTASFALGTPLMLGAAVGAVLLQSRGWMGPKAMSWQFVLGVGIACAVTALPILVLFLDKLELLRKPIGQRVLRYASVDDLAIWSVLAIILLDWSRIERQLCFLMIFAAATFPARNLIARLPEQERWCVSLVWLTACAFGSDWAGFHYIVGAFLAGVALNAGWFDSRRLDFFRQTILLILMPVFFLSTGLKTRWSFGEAMAITAYLLLLASVGGKLLGVWMAARTLRWNAGEASLIGWLLQTKALVMIIFANILLDKRIITSATFTALLLMAIASTALTMPVVVSKLRRHTVSVGSGSEIRTAP